jgi:hypothetical protein
MCAGADWDILHAARSCTRNAPQDTSCCARQSFHCSRARERAKVQLRSRLQYRRRNIEIKAANSKSTPPMLLQNARLAFCARTSGYRAEIEHVYATRPICFPGGWKTSAALLIKRQSLGAHLHTNEIRKYLNSLGVGCWQRKFISLLYVTWQFNSFCEFSLERGHKTEHFRTRLFN